MKSYDDKVFPQRAGQKFLVGNATVSSYRNVNGLQYKYSIIGKDGKHHIGMNLNEKEVRKEVNKLMANDTKEKHKPRFDDRKVYREVAESIEEMNLSEKKTMKEIEKRYKESKEFQKHDTLESFKNLVHYELYREYLY